MKIFIDPGHNPTGGDTGAVGYGLKEQDITVQIGVMLKSMLSSSGIDAKMSRESMNDVVSTNLSESLSMRYNAANNWGADYFISIHCNAANTKAYGCETYCYQSGTTGERLAESIQASLAETTKLTNRGVKTASFAVLKHTNMPSVLVETAFIDNYDDNRFLATTQGKNQCAYGIYKGTCKFLGIQYNSSFLEWSDELMSSEYDELKKKDESQDRVINAIGDDIVKNKSDIDAIKKDLARYDYIDNNMPTWAIPTITKLVTKGYLKGDESGKLNLTEDLMRLYVVNDRAGVYGQ